MSSTDTDERLLRDVGLVLAEVRQERGLTQQHVADAARVSLRWVQAAESGTQNLSLVSLAKFARALKVPVIRFFESPATRTRRKAGRPRTRR